MRHHAIRGRISGLDLDVERVLSVRNAAGGGLPLLSAVFSVSDSPGFAERAKFFSFSLLCFPDFFFGFPPLFSSSLCPPPRVFVSRPSVLFFSTFGPLVWVSCFFVPLLPSRVSRCREPGYRPKGRDFAFLLCRCGPLPFRVCETSRDALCVESNSSEPSSPFWGVVSAV